MLPQLHLVCMLAWLLVLHHHCPLLAAAPCTHTPPGVLSSPSLNTTIISLLYLQVLYDAFFKHQRKPKMTNLGELYYEGKEYEAKLEHLRPGVLSEELREALAMADSSPPPWLVNMQVGLSHCPQKGILGT